MKKSPNTIKNVLVIGLGRIGLPQSLILADSGIHVYGFDHGVLTVEQLLRNEPPFFEPGMEASLKKNQGKTFFPFSSWDMLNQYLPDIDAIIFTVGTKPPNIHELNGKQPFDLTDYFTLLKKIFSNKNILKKGIKLIIRTTLPLGSTDLLKNHLETHYSLQEGQDFYLAFVPERITEGWAMEELKTTPKIIGVYSDDAFEQIRPLFQNMGGKVLRVRNPITAEFCKLTDNSFRSTIFSYANEIAMRASPLDINVEEVINVVNNSYERNHIPQPGFVSGYCLSKDPYLFEIDFFKNFEKRSFHSIWYNGRKTNEYLIDFVVNKTLTHLNNKRGPCVTLLGLSFKEDVDDFRMSHSLIIMDKLIEAKILDLKVYDPYLNHNKYTRLPEDYLPYISTQSNTLGEHLFKGTDAIILCAPHQSLRKVNQVTKLSELFVHTNNPCYFFDGWDIWESATNIKHITYEGIGFKHHLQDEKPSHE
ncbi:TPA: nucleotide sugar dehydrogenase [Legionella pneumophila]|uniref:Nucleotide sugar dehydrogenase n=1 Tax=Legionella pneumophila TaxID=446 RepID=A0AAN5Q517_LEGPN|nr:nucleotide sugar dehydrogenase [Legionella pneumophila]RYX49033.1 nucleotide sugar dehydrogenase [Legionella pneumophila]HAT1864026.1 nucleotide sugar dehydrogenase [Legionella pneumophila]HAT7747163.1 nucleotide sugar dehydrogenase [Legionella pneumophila]HAT7759695.1 nucleotide sugar dehydrogenase [Legionella pneumophila]HAT8809442.1 nucleotide sugar dehydrogenase [Legionella pneumophila]